MATEGDTHLHPVTTGTMAALADIRPRHVIQMSQGPRGPPRRTPKTRQCAMTLQDGPHLQEGVGSQGPERTTPQTTLGIRLGTTMASGPPDRGTHTAPHAASPSSQWTCRANQQVYTGDLYASHRIAFNVNCNDITFALSV